MKGKTIRQLYNNPVYADISLNLLNQLQACIAKYVSMEGVLCCAYLKRPVEDLLSVSAPAHSCCVPVTVVGSEVRQIHTAWGMLLTLLDEERLISNMAPTKSLDAQFNCLKSLLCETILSPLRSALDTSCEHINEIHLCLKASSNSSGSKLIKLLLQGFLTAVDFGTIREAAYCRTDGGGNESSNILSIEVYYDSMQLYHEWRRYQFKLMANYLAAYGEMVFLQTQSDKAAATTLEKKRSHSRQRFCNHIITSVVIELCQTGLASKGIATLLLIGNTDTAFQKLFPCHALDDIPLGLYRTSVSGLQELIRMQRVLVTSSDTTSSVTTKYNDRFGPLSNQMKLFLLKRYMSHSIETHLARSLLQKSQKAHVGASFHSFLSLQSASPMKSEDCESLYENIQESLVAWQEDADLLHKQLRVLLHEGKDCNHDVNTRGMYGYALICLVVLYIGIYTHRDFSIARRVIQLMQEDLVRQKNEVFNVYVTAYRDIMTCPQLYTNNENKVRSTMHEFKEPILSLFETRQSELKRFLISIERKLEVSESAVCPSAASPEAPLVVEYALRIRHYGKRIVDTKPSAVTKYGNILFEERHVECTCCVLYLNVCLIAKY